MKLENFQAGWAPPQETESQGIYPGTQFMEIPSPQPRTGTGPIYYGRHE